LGRKLAWGVGHQFFALLGVEIFIILGFGSYFWFGAQQLNGHSEVLIVDLLSLLFLVRRNQGSLHLFVSKLQRRDLSTRNLKHWVQPFLFLKSISAACPYRMNRLQPIENLFVAFIDLLVFVTLFPFARRSPISVGKRSQWLLWKLAEMAFVRASRREAALAI
jgi:hypothetical protein